MKTKSDSQVPEHLFSGLRARLAREPPAGLRAPGRRQAALIAGALLIAALVLVASMRVYQRPAVGLTFGIRSAPALLAVLCALIGLAGAYLPLAVTGAYSDGIVGGRGWIALMVVIFGRWQPGWALVGAILFAYTEALQFKLALVTKAVPPQVLLMLPYLVAIVVLVRLYRGAEPPRALGLPYERESRI